MTNLILILSNHLLVALEIIVLMFFATVFFQKRLSRIQFWASISLLILGNIITLIFWDKIFWLKVFVLVTLDALWLKSAYIDTFIQSVGIAIGFYSFVNVWDVNCYKALHGFSIYEETERLDTVESSKRTITSHTLTKE